MNFVIVGGVDLWRSTNGGDLLVDISTWWDPRSAHADHHCITSAAGFNGTTNRRVFFGCDGGVFTTADVRTVGNNAQLPRINGWAELVNTYSVTQFYGAAGNATSGVIVGGTQDNGTICLQPTAGSENWRTIFGGDGGWCAADPTDPKVFYGEYVFLNIHRNLDGGTSDDTDGDRYISGQFWNDAQQRWDWKPIPFTHSRRAKSPGAVHRTLYPRSERREPAPGRRPVAVANQRREDGEHADERAVVGGDQAERWTAHQRDRRGEREQQHRLGRPHRRPGVQDDERAGGVADLAARRSDRAESTRRGALLHEHHGRSQEFADRVCDLRRLCLGQRVEDD